MKFFLHGWCASIDSPKNKEFFQSFCGHGSKILILPFGWEPEEQIFNDYKQNFIKHNPDNNLLFMCASRDISTLIDQIKNNDILFFPWWKPYKYFELINRIPNFKELCKNKTIAGASWWAIMWAKVYYSSNAENLREWNGFLPIKIIVHRWSDKHPWLSREEREILLDQYGEKLPIYKIPEQEYVEFTI
jgi:hypothetical protein